MIWERSEINNQNKYFHLNTCQSKSPNTLHSNTQDVYEIKCNSHSESVWIYLPEKGVKSYIRDQTSVTVLYEVSTLTGIE